MRRGFSHCLQHFPFCLSPAGYAVPPASAGCSLVVVNAAAPFCNVARFLADSAERQPDGLAVRAPVGRRGTTILYREKTFAQLHDETKACAAFLESRGLRRRMRVLLLVRPGLDLIRLTFALFQMGTVPVVIDPGMGLANFLRCVRQSRPEALIGIPPAVWMRRIFRSSFRTVRHTITVDRNFQNRWDPQSSLDPVLTRPDELAAVLFTSGSTGAPKGVCYEHAQFEAQVRLIGTHYGIQRGEIDLPMLPIFALFNPAFGMATVVPQMNPSRPAAADPALIVQAIRQNQVTNSFGSPTLWRKVCDYCRLHQLQLPSLRRILIAGAPVPSSLLRDLQPLLPHGQIHTPYGATECLPLCSIDAGEVLQRTSARSESGWGTCVGRPLPEISLRLEPLPESIYWPRRPVGELTACGPVVTKSYDHLPQATAAAKKIDTEGRLWHRLGDAGYQDEEGRWWFLGRMAERVPTSLGTMFTECCEAVFHLHPKVCRTALIAWREGQTIHPALVVEPKARHWPANRHERLILAGELHALGQSCEATRPIHRYFFRRRFPVDVRHNAKIHRLTLSRQLASAKPIVLS